MLDCVVITEIITGAMQLYSSNISNKTARGLYAHITNNFISKLKVPTNNLLQKRYYDDYLKGFGIRVTTNGVKSFFIEKRTNNKVYRTILGQISCTNCQKYQKESTRLFRQNSNWRQSYSRKEERAN